MLERDAEGYVYLNKNEILVLNNLNDKERDAIINNQSFEIINRIPYVRYEAIVQWLKELIDE